MMMHNNKIEQYEKVFSQFDENGDGKISPTELCLCLALMGGEELSLSEAESAVESMDSDGDGLLEIQDFVRLMDGAGDEDKAKELREAFRMYEMDGSGTITPKSLKRMLKKLGESMSMEECKRMIRTYDINGDGVLNFDEFKRMMA